MSVRERRNRKGLATPGGYEPQRSRGELDRLIPERVVSFDPDGTPRTVIDFRSLRREPDLGFLDRDS